MKEVHRTLYLQGEVENRICLAGSMKERTFLNTLAALLIMGASVSGTVAAQAIIEQGGKGAWNWNRNIASTEFNNGISLRVIFASDADCNDAYFALAGNDQITSVRFIIDTNTYNGVDVEPFYVEGTPLVAFTLSDKAVYDLKHGNRLRIDTNVGSLMVDLSGSALAFNNAYRNCMQIVAPPMLQPSFSEPPTARAEVDARAGDDKISSFDADSGGTVLVFDGDFEEGDGQAVIEALRRTGASVLGLESSGGLVSEAQMIGYYVRSNNIKTFAGDLCASACTFALAGGVDRYAFADSQIGIHRSSLLAGGGSLEDGQQLLANYLRYFSSMGIDPELVAIAGNVSSERIRWLTQAEALRLDLVTGVIER
ncbi:MAG: hypothetical protein KFB96_22240 [Thiocapsa sp.]|uniref:COG3904 family protein n=1 Tax=Thiocapsa sp. TaxID=2024551 RepID=UPI001BCD26B2|nr:hypothetical protein [Thiocapsa sp.]QVL48307.1 MAG: hypothetical protein KFB96_22240 [Thiocapsa sp.]